MIDVDVRMTVTTAASQMTGTSSRLTAGCEISLEDALYALMLPSGNDAAYLLAENIGLLITYGRVKLRNHPHQYSSIELLDLSSFASTEKFVGSFVRQMNRKAKQMGMDCTSFDNPHGMQSSENYSTTLDLLLLSRYCQANWKSMQIAFCQEYTALQYQPPHHHSKRRSTNWNGEILISFSIKVGRGSKLVIPRLMVVAFPVIGRASSS